jgi:hypothetical protein
MVFHAASLSLFAPGVKLSLDFIEAAPSPEVAALHKLIIV